MKALHDKETPKDPNIVQSIFAFTNAADKRGLNFTNLINKPGLNNQKVSRFQPYPTAPFTAEQSREYYKRLVDANPNIRPPPHLTRYVAGGPRPQYAIKPNRPYQPQTRPASIIKQTEHFK